MHLFEDIVKLEKLFHQLLDKVDDDLFSAAPSKNISNSVNLYIFTQNKFYTWKAEDFLLYRTNFVEIEMNSTELQIYIQEFGKTIANVLRRSLSNRFLSNQT